MVKFISTQDELLDRVKAMSSPAANTLALECVWVCSELLTLFAVPPKAVVLILKVAVQVPLALLVVVSTI